MKVLVTGGTGTISSGLVKESVEKGYTTYAMTRGNNKSRNIEGAVWLYVDVFDAKSVEDVLCDMTFDVVVECLAYTTAQLEVSLNSFWKRTKQYIFISTAGIYNRKDERIKEEDKKEFDDWAYTRDKIECEKFLIDFCNGKKIDYTIVRPTVTYGDYRIPFPIATRTPGWTLFDRMMSGSPIVASDNVKYSVIHIEDFSKAVIGLFGNSFAYNNDFHISSNMNDIYWDDVIDVVGTILGVTPQIVHAPIEAFEIMWPEIHDELRYNKNLTTIFDDEKIIKATNFEASIDIYEGMRKTITAMRKEFKDLNLCVDRFWNAKCDVVLLYAYKKNMLNYEEKRIVEDYVKNNKKRVTRSIFIVKLNVLKRRGYGFLRCCKKIIKN